MQTNVSKDPLIWEFCAEFPSTLVSVDCCSPEQGPQVFAVGAFAHCRGCGFDLRPVNPAVLPRNFSETGKLDSLPFLEGLGYLWGVKQAIGPRPHSMPSTPP